MGRDPAVRPAGVGRWCLVTDARLPERLLSDRRLLRLSDRAHRLYVHGLLWAVANRTDGHLDVTDLTFMSAVDPAAAGEVVASGLWSDAPAGGYDIAEFATTQTTAAELAQLDRIRARDRERKARTRAERRAAADECPPDSPADSPQDGHGDGSTGQHRTGQDRPGQANYPARETTTNGHRPERADALAARGWDS